MFTVEPRTLKSTAWWVDEHLFQTSPCRLNRTALCNWPSLKPTQFKTYAVDVGEHSIIVDDTLPVLNNADVRPRPRIANDAATIWPGALHRWASIRPAGERDNEKFHFAEVGWILISGGHGSTWEAAPRPSVLILLQLEMRRFKG